MHDMQHMLDMHDLQFVIDTVAAAILQASMAPKRNKAMSSRPSAMSGRGHVDVVPQEKLEDAIMEWLRHHNGRMDLHAYMDQLRTQAWGT